MDNEGPNRLGCARHGNFLIHLALHHLHQVGQDDRPVHLHPQVPQQVFTILRSKMMFMVPGSTKSDSLAPPTAMAMQRPEPLRPQVHTSQPPQSCRAAKTSAGRMMPPYAADWAKPYSGLISGIENKNRCGGGGLTCRQCVGRLPCLCPACL